MLPRGGVSGSLCEMRRGRRQNHERQVPRTHHANASGRERHGLQVGSRVGVRACATLNASSACKKECLGFGSSSRDQTVRWRKTRARQESRSQGVPNSQRVHSQDDEASIGKVNGRARQLEIERDVVVVWRRCDKPVWVGLHSVSSIINDNQSDLASVGAGLW